jgi:acyl-coenzyme A thioesterase 13
LSSSRVVVTRGVRRLDILTATPGRVRASLRIEPYNLNRLHGLHGGLICTLVDTMGSLALSSRGLWLTGVCVRSRL